MLDAYYAAVDFARVLMLFTGSVIVFMGIIWAAAADARGAEGWARVARRIGSHVALGLEFFIGASLLNLIVNPPTWAALAATAVIIVARKLVTLSLSRAGREAPGDITG